MSPEDTPAPRQPRKLKTIGQSGEFVDRDIGTAAVHGEVDELGRCAVCFALPDERHTSDKYGQPCPSRGRLFTGA